MKLNALSMHVMCLCEGQPNMLVLRHDSDRVVVGVCVYAVYFDLQFTLQSPLLLHYRLEISGELVCSLAMACH